MGSPLKQISFYLLSLALFSFLVTISVNNATTISNKHKVLKDTIPSVCVNDLLSLIASTPYYKERTGYAAELKKNGGKFVLRTEASPYPKQDDADNYSDTYDVALAECYTDRMSVIDRFTYNSKTSSLYRQLVSEDSLIPIVLNKTQVLHMRKNCREKQRKTRQENKGKWQAGVGVGIQ